MTTACDYRLMSGESLATGIGFVHAKLGLVPAWGGFGRLSSIVGPRKAMDMLLDCRIVAAAEAMNVGLVDGTAATLADATEWLSQKIRHPVQVTQTIKRIRLCYGYESNEHAAGISERRLFMPLWGGSINQEAVERLISKQDDGS